MPESLVRLFEDRFEAIAVARARERDHQLLCLLVGGRRTAADGRASIRRAVPTALCGPSGAPERVAR